MKYELTIEKTAHILGVSESRVSQLISNGTLDSTTINGRRRISGESVKQYRDEIRRTGRPPKKKPLATEYLLMNGNYEVLRLSYEPKRDDPFTVKEVLDAARAPWGTVTRNEYGKKRQFNAWWRSRAIPNARPGINSKLASLHMSYTFEIPFKNLGLSLSDCYWIRPADERIDTSWDEINYFDNAFDGAIQDWDSWLASIGLDSPDNTSEGLLPKRWIIEDDKRLLAKGCRSDDQRPYNEAVATLLHDRLLDPHEFVHYQMARFADGPACVCPNFLSSHEEYIPAAYMHDTIPNIKGTSTYDRFCKYVGRLGMNEHDYRKRMSKMITCDAILANSDRHWRNFGFIRNVDTLELKPAPLFDSGNCLWYNKTASEVGACDWSYIAKPFGPEPERQLALVESAEWFSAEALEGFVHEACNILAESEHARPRIDYLAQGLKQHVEDISKLMKVVSFRS